MQCFLWSICVVFFYSFKLRIYRKIVDRVLELVLPAFVLQSPLFIHVSGDYLEMSSSPICICN